MVRRYLLPLLAVAGVAFAMWTVVLGNRPVPAAPPVASPAPAPFASYVAGSGIIEPSTQNIAIGTHVSGVVTGIFVQVGDTVKAGDPLFALDDRALQAELVQRRASLHMQQEQLTKLLRQPRPEEVPQDEANVKAAEAALGDARNQLALAESLQDKRAMSAEDLSKRRWAVVTNDAKLAQARAQLALRKAGAWKPDVDIARAQVVTAEAQLKQTEIDIARLTLRALVSGQILQVNIRLGEFAQAGVLTTPLLLLGNVEPLHVRVDIDENDAWRVRPEAAAMASMRGNRELKTPLQFVRFEPYVVPKKSLTGDTTERVDTRVLQVLYRFNRGDLPVYVGQQMDVFIEAPSVGSMPMGNSMAQRPGASAKGGQL
jgi:HlyD family secretion protein